MVGQVARAGRVLFVAAGTQIVVVTDQAFEAAAAEVALQARITAHT